MLRPSVTLLVGLLFLGAAGCGASPTGAPGAASSEARSPGTPTDEPAPCPLEQQPGPADKGPGPVVGEGPDLADFGGGRWRLCISEPNEVMVEGSAFCVWNDARTAVEQVQGIGVPAPGGGAVSGGVSIADGGMSFSVDRPTASTGFQGRAAGASIPAGAVTGSVSGRLTAFVPEGESAPPSPAQAATITWACGAPPAQRAGRATGTVDLVLDAPVSLTRRLTAACDWVTTPTGPRVTHLVTDPLELTVDGRRVTVEIDPDESPLSAVVWVDDTMDSTTYEPADHGVVAAIVGADAGHGSARLRRLDAEAGSTVRLRPGLDALSGIVRWTCPPPAVAGIAVGPDDPPVDPDLRRTVPGHARLRFDPAVVPVVEGDVTCTLDDSDPGYLRVARVSGTFQADGRRISFTSEDYAVLLVLDRGTTPDGEYSGSIARIGDEIGRGDLILDVPALRFEPTDPRYIPLGGPTAERTLAVLVTYSCEAVAPS
jgi:hypothetical protein